MDSGDDDTLYTDYEISFPKVDFFKTNVKTPDKEYILKGKDLSVYVSDSGKQVSKKNSMTPRDCYDTVLSSPQLLKAFSRKRVNMPHTPGDEPSMMAGPPDTVLHTSLAQMLTDSSIEMRNDMNETAKRQNELTQSLINIQQKQQKLQDEQKRNASENTAKKCRKDLLLLITKSDGLVIQELLQFCDSIETAAKGCETRMVDYDYIWLALNASRGDLHKVIVEFRQDNPGSSWNDVKKKIVETFVGPNAVDIFRQALENFKQSPTEPLLTFNRRFRTAVSRAYPNLTEDTDRIVLKNYVRAIRDPHVVTRLFNGHNNPKTFEEAVKAVEKIHSTLSQLQSIGITIPSDQLEFGVTDKNETSISVYEKKINTTNEKVNKQSTELEKCKLQLQQMKDKVVQLERFNNKQTNKVDNYQRHPQGQANYRQTTFRNQNIEADRRGYQGNQGRNVRFAPQSDNHTYRQTNDQNTRPDFRWTAEGRPICHNCQIVGHIQRFCNKIRPSKN